ncbi:cytochrome c oxidase subunit II [Oxalobacteraceae bacterium OM1]|nr:cytochrome c oxidase subunit II [Oxalobacteraceae bacterium OM1]
MDYLWTHGPSADPVTRLTWGLTAISLLVIVIIAGLVLFACLHRRPPDAVPEAPGRLPVGPEAGGLPWITIGVGISTLVLFGSTVWTIRALAAVASPERAALAIDVIAHQWWWEVRYPGAAPGEQIVTANEIHIPANEPVHVRLESVDVIHSFWIPKLAGKTDLIPGQINHAWLQAVEPGTYQGICGEFCGPQHAHMMLRVVAEDQAHFDAWRKQQSEQAAPADQTSATQGRTVFLSHCIKCHTIRGTPADHGDGPDLTHLMSRQTIAAGMLPNSTAALAGWVADAQGIKPGARMPTMHLSPEELRTVVAYLQTLH